MLTQLVLTIFLDETFDIRNVHLFCAVEGSRHQIGSIIGKNANPGAIHTYGIDIGDDGILYTSYQVVRALFNFVNASHLDSTFCTMNTLGYLRCVGF